MVKNKETWPITKTYQNFVKSRISYNVKNGSFLRVRLELVCFSNLMYTQVT